MNMNNQMEEAESSILHTYNRFPVVFERGEGVHLFDSEGSKYLDFAAGIAVNSLGYHYPGYDEALKEQINKLTHISNLYYNEPIIEAGAKLVNASRMDKAFFTNSGTEAIEGALKAAKKYAYERDGHANHEIIAMNHSFHGRSIGALSVTGNAHYREPFEPLMGGVKFADFNDLESVKAQITDKTCAIIMETVQGEGGIYPAEIRLIDWEYAGMQDPHVDVAMFCIYSLYNKRQVDRLIAAYFTEGCGDETRIKIYCYIAACGLLWSNWCEYKRNLGVEFGEYSLRQYRYAKDYYRIVQEELKKQGEEE